MTFATQIQQMIRISLAAAGLTLAPSHSFAAQAVVSPLLIYQLQSGAPSSASQEYIAIYNSSNDPVEVTSWCVTYASSSDITQTQLGCLKALEPSSKLYLQSRQALFLATAEFVQAHPGFTPDLVFTAGIASTSGHIKLLDPAKNSVDLVGWGSATHPENLAVTAPTTGKILQRRITEPGILQDTNNNKADFFETELALSQTGNVYEESAPILEPCTIPQINCAQPANPDKALLLSEIMPDASSADAGKEFIELYNSSDMPINLAGYSLSLGPSFVKLYPLPATILQAKTYVSFSDTETGIVLPNTSATIRLISLPGTVVGELNYADLEEDMSLAYSTDSWQKTYQLTPGSDNVIVAAKPCPEGQTRNVESGQCVNSALAAGPVPCKPGQVRNLETGRCRNVVTATTTAAACKAGQEKNPATNRCRNIANATTPAPCPAGQERNAETGRCRKITALAAAGTNSVKDVPSALVTNNIKWWVAGVAALGAVCYAVYEWRRELFGLLSSVKGKFVQEGVSAH